jgi:hypothetical protein
MPFRVKAFALHLLASASALTLILGTLFFGWYHWPGWYLTAVGKVLLIMCAVDLVLGPTLTLVIANPSKPRRELARDIGIIATVQIVALVYGTVTLWMGRPLYYTFSVNRLETVQSSDLSSDEITSALEESSAFAPHWYSTPRWVWAPLPEDPDKAAKIVSGAGLGGGPDVIDMPRYFRAWEAGLPALRQQLNPIADITYFSKPEKERLRERMIRLGLDPQERNAIVMWGATGSGRKLLVVFDSAALKMRAMLRPE